MRSLDCAVIDGDGWDVQWATVVSQSHEKRNDVISDFSVAVSVEFPARYADWNSLLKFLVDITWGRKWRSASFSSIFESAPSKLTVSL